MTFLIADTFTSSLHKLTGDEQKSAKTTAFDLQMDPAHPGLNFHKINASKDHNFSSVRVSRDIRLIVHQTVDNLLLCYVGHHDDAYRWAERRKIETHPKTGAAQLVEVRESVQEISVPRYVEEERTAYSTTPLFVDIPEDELLGYGVPEEWVEDVQQSDEDSLLELADHLPAEAAEALLELATGGTPQQVPADEIMHEMPFSEVEARVPPASVGPATSFAELHPEDPFEHPDAKRRFRVMNDVEELERALEYPWERWTIFLHPEQRRLVERDYSGPARVSGSAGTGKTVVALHRAAFLARANPDARVLLTTFSDALANSLSTKLMRLISSEPRLGERLEVHSMDAIGERLYKTNVGPVDIAPRDVVRDLLEGAADAVEGHRFSLGFLLAEWEQVVDAWQVATWEEYRDVRRLGRKTRLPEAHRRVFWEIFAGVRSGLEARGLTTRADMLTRLASYVRSMRHPPFDFVVVDEAQDITVAQLRFLAALGDDRPNSLFFAGDLGQRIFQQPFSWKSLGVDIRGRSRTLRVNYRTSHQIRTQADLLLANEVADVDGVAERRSGTVSVFNGPEPTICVLEGIDEEIKAVASWLSERTTEGVVPHEIGVFVRSPAQLGRACAAVEEAGLPIKVLDEKIETASGRVSISTMHLAKGLEFRAVVVMACDDEIIPLQDRIETVADESDLLEVYDTERHLLYVACTRARDYLLVTSGDLPSEFLDDLQM